MKRTYHEDLHYAVFHSLFLFIGPNILLSLMLTSILTRNIKRKTSAIH